MRFGQDSHFGVNCNCNLFPVNQYKGLVRKPIEAKPSDSIDMQQNAKTKQKISLRKSSLNSNRDMFEGFQSRRTNTPESQIKKGWKNAKSTLLVEKNPANLQRFSQKGTYLLEHNNGVTIKLHETQQKTRKGCNSSLSPHFKTASNFKNDRLQTEAKGSLIKRFPLKQMNSFKENRNNVQKALFQNIDLKPDNENQKIQKCSFTTMAGSNAGYINFNGARHMVSDLKQNVEKNYMECSQHDSEYYENRTNQVKSKMQVYSHSLNDLLYRQAESLLGQGESIDDSDFSEVVHSSKRIEGLELINNYKSVNPFIRLDNIDGADKQSI